MYRVYEGFKNVIFLSVNYTIGANNPQDVDKKGINNNE